jgi:hypothetical protein
LVLAPIILLAGLGIGLFIFKDQIASFVSGGLTDVGKNVDQFGKDVQTNIGQIGKDIGDFGKEQQKNFDDFVTRTQGDIDQSIIGTEQKINQFFTDAQSNFDANIAGITAGITDQQRAIDQFGKDVQTNIANTAGGIQQGFDDFGKGVAQIFTNPFGGQDKPKEITKTVNAMTLNKPTGQNISRSNRGTESTKPTLRDLALGGFLTDAGQHTSKPDILIMKDRPLSIGAIKPAVQTQTTPTVSKFLTNPSQASETNVEVKKIEETTQRATRFSR